MCEQEGCETRTMNPLPKLKRCGQCEYTRYCSDKCQKADWPKHKSHCSTFNEKDIHPAQDRDFARNAAEFEAESRMDYIRQHVPPGVDPVIIVDFTTMKRYLKIGGIPQPDASKEATVGIYAKVQFGKNVVQSLGAVAAWSELKEAGSERGYWYKPGTNGHPLTKSMARANEAESALVLPGESSSSKNKKKNKKKKKSTAEPQPEGEPTPEVD
ncbi:hypothetical protein BDZ89DRAFT_404904 [Hymenopellis radicata]|nr:hypothetical protein BDZ89DRAFT_404904 [Hymenopellis radicata]